MDIHFTECRSCILMPKKKWCLSVLRCLENLSLFVNLIYDTLAWWVICSLLNLNCFQFCFLSPGCIMHVLSNPPFFFLHLSRKLFDNQKSEPYIIASSWLKYFCCFDAGEHDTDVDGHGCSGYYQKTSSSDHYFPEGSWYQVDHYYFILFQD